MPPPREWAQTPESWPLSEPERLSHGRLRLRALVEPTWVFKSALNPTDSFTNSTTFSLQ
jgi:hypothetical protein